MRWNGDAAVALVRSGKPFRFEQGFLPWCRAGRVLLFWSGFWRHTWKLCFCSVFGLICLLLARCLSCYSGVFVWMPSWWLIGWLGGGLNTDSTGVKVREYGYRSITIYSVVVNSASISFFLAPLQFQSINKQFPIKRAPRGRRPRSQRCASSCGSKRGRASPPWSILCDLSLRPLRISERSRPPRAIPQQRVTKRGRGTTSWAPTRATDGA